MKYEERQIFVDAIQFFPDRKPWPKRVRTFGGIANSYCLEFDNLPNTSEIKPSDWVITEENGNESVCTDAHFNVLYKPVDTNMIDILKAKIKLLDKVIDIIINSGLVNEDKNFWIKQAKKNRKIL